MRILEVTACPGCGSTGSRPFRDEAFELLQCPTCDLVHAPTYGDPEEIYVAGYLTGETDFGLDLRDPLFQEFLEFAGRRRVAVVEKLTGGPSSWLDVGCGAGELLAVARDRGWRTAGAEPVEASAETARARGLDIRTAMLEDSGLPEGQWDVVSAYHVLEHMVDGPAFLQQLARWASPGGLVAVEVPNWGSFDREKHGLGWPGLRRLEHIAHYDPTTLRRTIVAAGLEPVEVRSMGFLWDRQTLDQQLADLARRRWRPLLARLSRPGDGSDGGIYPRLLLRRLLLAVQAAYDVRGKGQVIVGVGRVPTEA